MRGGLRRQLLLEDGLVSLPLLLLLLVGVSGTAGASEAAADDEGLRYNRPGEAI